MKKLLPLVFALTLGPLFAADTIGPKGYEAMQAKAPEVVNVEVLKVEVSPGSTPDLQNILLVVLVDSVNRTGTGLKPQDIINVSYSVTERPKGWNGPGEVPIPHEKDQSIAYLIKGETGDYAPAAGRMSFSNF